MTTVFSEPAYTVPASPTWGSLAGTLYGSSEAAAVLETTLTAAGYTLADSSIQRDDLPPTLSSVGSATTTYAYNEAGQLLGEYDEQGTAQVEYVWFNGQPLAQVTASNTYTCHYDHLGTPRVLTDESGSLVWEATYTPFGEAALTTEMIVNNLRFPGQYFDSETNLHYNYFRYYDPSTGRYTKSDPIGLMGGINTYAYAGNNPLKYFDPLGLDYMPEFIPDNCKFIVLDDMSSIDIELVIGAARMYDQKIKTFGLNYNKKRKMWMVLIIGFEYWEQVTQRFLVNTIDINFNIKCREEDECGNEYYTTDWGSAYHQTSTKLSSVVNKWTVPKIYWDIVGKPK